MRDQLNRDEKVALSRLFSPSVIREFAADGASATFANLANQTPSIDRESKSFTVAQYFEAAFSLLSKPDNRDQYVYRSALTKNILLGRHSLNTASVLPEFRVADRKVDLGILNGTSTAYEIKSERDTLARLLDQLSAYRRVFARSFVICGERHVSAILQAVHEDVGVLCLSSRAKISTVREAADRSSQVDTIAILDSLRTDEAKVVLTHLGVTVPDLPNTLIRSALEKLFRELESKPTHDAMVRVLKKTRSLAGLSPFLSKLPASLRAAAVSIQPNRVSDQNNFIQAIDTPLARALHWA